jgi:hypothetical protein
MTTAQDTLYRPPAPGPMRGDDKGRRIAVVVRRALLMVVKALEDEFELAPAEKQKAA